MLNSIIRGKPSFALEARRREHREEPARGVPRDQREALLRGQVVQQLTELVHEDLGVLWSGRFH